MNCEIQEAYFQSRIRRNIQVYLQSGVRITGTLMNSSANCLSIATDNCRMLIFKHAITSVVPT